MSLPNPNQTICAIINPKSGSGEHNNLIETLKQKLGDRVLLTSGSDDQRRIREFYENYPSQLCIVGGGDGTIKLAAESLIDAEVPLGLLPLGSANGLAAEWDLDKPPLSLLDHYLSGNYDTLNLDGISINNEICLHMADVGLNASMIRSFDKQPIRGFAGYALSALNELTEAILEERQLKFTAEIDGREFQTSMLLIANCKKYGTGVTVNPDGKPNDGEFEIGPLKEFEISHLGAFLFGQSSNKQQHNAPFDLQSVTRTSVKLSHPVDFQVDGEYIGEADQLSVEIQPQFCKLAIPSKS